WWRWGGRAAGRGQLGQLRELAQQARKVRDGSVGADCIGGSDTLADGIHRTVKQVERFGANAKRAAFPGGERALERLADRLDVGEVRGAGGALQAVGVAENLFDQRRGGGRFLELEQAGGDRLHMLVRLH